MTAAACDAVWRTMTAAQLEAVVPYRERMHQRVKLDPPAYVLLCAVLGIQIYTSFLRDRDVDRLVEESDRMYKTAVFDDTDSNIMRQIFRQNEVDRDLLKAVLYSCGR